MRQKKRRATTTLLLSTVTLLLLAAAMLLPHTNSTPQSKGSFGVTPIYITLPVTIGPGKFILSTIPPGSTPVPGRILITVIAITTTPSTTLNSPQQFSIP